jgi:hypothetical protein
MIDLTKRKRGEAEKGIRTYLEKMSLSPFPTFVQLLELVGASLVKLHQTIKVAILYLFLPRQLVRPVFIPVGKPIAIRLVFGFP